MISYYTCIMILSLTALAILGVMVWENNRLEYSGVAEPPNPMK